ncbi:distal tail protein Dit [Petroclostridium xylanilyticum]|jgi:predicted phage tail component-like protein|uniref:distal tail protein Dit n=1 Tax=Petroclostridium xylanilyticum TaxID=1792311 RepID=UPI000B988D11|nr:distal tail protein Dit [Petroclostridium xylanilyticum]
MGFIYNGISSQSMKIRARLTKWQVSPALRNSFETVPGKAGIADFGCDISERNIIIICSVLPQRSFAELVSVLDNVAEWLNPENGLKQLVLDDLPDRYFMARLSEAVDCERLLRTAGSFELRFVCPDPYAYALEDEVFVLSETGLHELERVKGNADSNPVYLLKGLISTSSSSYISLITNGEELRIVGSLSEGETLVIDSTMVTAKVIDETGGTLRNGLSSLQDLNFPILRKGVNNIEIAAANATFTELKIQAKSRWR